MNIDHEIRTSYLRDIFTQPVFSKLVNSLIKQIKESQIEFQTIAFSGQSGAMVAPIVCYRLKKMPLLIRKKTDNSHSSFSIEGPTKNFDYIIIDDLFSTGATISFIHEKVNSLINKLPKAIFFYSQPDNNPRIPKEFCDVPFFFRYKDKKIWTKEIRQSIPSEVEG